jgi:hypothetical protein
MIEFLKLHQAGVEEVKLKPSYLVRERFNGWIHDSAEVI